MKRKSGNIDDFCRRWGNQQRYMVVLDADSVMSGECLACVRLMEANPNATPGLSSLRRKRRGWIPGMPAANSSRPASMGRCLPPGCTSGSWGVNPTGAQCHIRVKPFIEHCACTPLPGEGSFAGSILPHDFVEAALMRRAGWGVWIAYDPRLLAKSCRQTCWMSLNATAAGVTGNLMNFVCSSVKGMHPVHRRVPDGVMSYLSALLWFMFLALLPRCRSFHALTEPCAIFPSAAPVFPVWPQWRPNWQSRCLHQRWCCCSRLCRSVLCRDLV